MVTTAQQSAECHRAEFPGRGWNGLLIVTELSSQAELCREEVSLASSCWAGCFSELPVVEFSIWRRCVASVFLQSLTWAYAWMERLKLLDLWLPSLISNKYALNLAIVEAFFCFSIELLLKNTSGWYLARMSDEQFCSPAERATLTF